MGEGLGETSTALSFGLTGSFWLASCWCLPRMYVRGQALGNIFTALRCFFLFSAASRQVYNTLLTLGRRIIFLPPSEVCVRSFFCHHHFNRIYTAQSSGWRSLPLVPELNLLQRPQIQWNTVSFRLLSWGLVWDPKTRCKLSLYSKGNHHNKNPVNCGEESPCLRSTSQRAQQDPALPRINKSFRKA